MNKFGKAILGTVFTFEETADKPATPATNNNSSANTNKQNDSQNDFSQTATPEYHPMQTAQVGDTQKYKEHFLKVMKDNNLPGPDYYELSSSIDSLIPVISDVKTRFMSAFTMLSATGLTKDKALSSAQTYLTALDNDAANFATSLQQVKAQEVDGQRAQMDANTKQIQDLNLKIQQLNADNLDIQQKVFASESRIAQSKAGYDVELNNMKKNINDNLSYLNQFIN